MIIKNFTPHNVVVLPSSVYAKSLTENGMEILVAEGIAECYPSLGVARASEVCAESEAINGIPTVAKRYDAVVGLPEPEPGVVYIVSLPVLQASYRNDLVCPDTGPDSVVRDKTGKILGVRRFQRSQVCDREESKLEEDLQTIIFELKKEGNDIDGPVFRAVNGHYYALKYTPTGSCWVSEFVRLM
jgi:hypothetical protein